jgi:FixJ family two-component response regulator
LNGLQLFHRLRNGHIDTPFVLISGHADEQTIAQAMSAGVSEFLLKPVPPRNLIAVLKNATRSNTVSE